MPRTSDEREVFIDENRPLMELCSSVARDLYIADECRALLSWISENAAIFNQSNYGRQFGIIQRMAAADGFSAIGRAFDEHNDTEVHCIKGILVLMRSSHLIDRETLLSYLSNLPNHHRFSAIMDNIQLRDRAVSFLMQTRPTPRSSEQLMRVLQVRHTEIAHSARERPESRATFDDLDHCLTWAKHFIGMVGRAFGNFVFEFSDGEFFSDTDVQSTIISFRRLAHSADIIRDPYFSILD